MINNECSNIKKEKWRKSKFESVLLSYNKIINFFQRLRTSISPNIEELLERKFLGRDFSELLVYFSIILYTIIFSYYTILKFYSFSAYAWDLGIFNQSLWSTVNGGNFFFSNVELFVNPSGIFFGIHFSPILFIVLPFYSLYSSVETLLIFQSFILALGAIPLYYYAKNALKQRTIAVVFSLAYLMYPALHGINWFDFHVQAFLPVLLFSLMYCLKKEKWPLYFFFVFLSLFVAENVPLIILFIGFYCFWFYRKQIFKAIKAKKITDNRIFVPILTIVLALSWMLLALWIQKTYFPVDSAYSELYKAVDNWSILGIKNDPITLPLYVIFNPGNMIDAISYELFEKSLYLVLLFTPLLFLSFKSSITAISLAWFFPVLLSNYRPYYLLGTHFPAYVIAFLFIGAIEGMKKNVSLPHFPTLNMYSKYMLLASLIFLVFVSPLSPLLGSFSNNFSEANTFFSVYRPPEIKEHDKLLQKVVDLVPNDASILTQNNIFPHFSNRINSYVYPVSVYIEKAPPEAIDNYINDLVNKSEFVLIDFATDFFSSDAILKKIDSTDIYGVYAIVDEIRLFKKNYQGELVLIE